MSGTPSGAANAAGTPAANRNVENMLQELLARQARDADNIARRRDAMQAEIDSRAPALDTLHTGAAAPSALAVATSGGEPGWLRRIVTGGRSPAAPAGQLAAAAPSAADAPSTPAHLALAPRARFDLSSALPPGAPPAPTRGSRRLPPSGPATCDGAAASADPARSSTVARAHAAAAVDLDDDDEDYFDALDEQLEQLDAAPDPDKSLADRFGGHPLPLQHVARRWPRDVNFQPQTCHYHPSLAGDRLNGGLVDQLTKIGEQQHAARQPEWGATYAYELRTLVSTCSYMADTFEAQKSTCAAINAALRSGHAMPAGLESLPQDSLDMAVQLQSIFAHLKERVDVLRATVRQGVDVEILARLYDSEERIAGDRSDLGAAVEARTLEGATRKMIAASATERVAAAAGSARLTPRGPPPRERTGGGREPRSARDRARRLQPVATSARTNSGQNLQSRSSGQLQQPPRTSTSRATSPAGTPAPAPAPAPAQTPRGGGGRGAGGGSRGGRGGPAAA